MVAISGAGWKLAPSLIALILETDDRFPTREHTSDGSIGDSAHAARTSDHNPDDGWVCAVDIDEDLSPTLHSIRFLWDLIIDRRDHRVKYLIYEGQIVKSYVDSAGHRPWTPYPYTGTNAHAHHLHVSIFNTPAARDDTGPWWESVAPAAITEPEGDRMFLAKKKSGGGTYLIEPGRMTAMKSQSDLEAIADALGVPRAAAPVSDAQWDALKKNRTVYS